MANKNKYKVVLRGKEVEIIYRQTREDEIGACLFSDNKIIISPNFEGKDLLDIELHEALHMCLPDMVEDVINETAKSLAGMLDILGYKKTKKSSKK